MESILNITHNSPNYRFNKSDNLVNYNMNNINLSYSERIKDLRNAGNCHKEVRQQLYKYIKPGKKIFDICNSIEKSIENHFKQNNYPPPHGFPVGFSINNCIAHDTARVDDQRILTEDDIVKIDFGTHVNGNIIDSAFTYSYNTKYENLITSTKDATWSAIKMIGPDTYVNDISKVIKEIIESYEIEIDSKIYNIIPVKNLGGHNIKPYVIHGGTLILCEPNNNNLIKAMRIKENECYAIETFAFIDIDNTKYNNINCEQFNTLNDENNLFSINTNTSNYKLKLDISIKMLQYIKHTYSTLPFCSRWLYHKFGVRYKIGISELVKNNVINVYPPLTIKNVNCYSSQLEHTIFVHEYGKEIVSFGNDY
jgi:methionyl aminopeptidase